MSDNSQIPRIAVIGTGSMAVKRHLPALKQLERENRCRLVIVSDISIQAVQIAAKKFEIAEFTTEPDSIFSRSDIDAVYVFASPEVHYEYGMAALKQGKHIFLEKPPAENSLQILEMATLAKLKQCIAVAGFNRRFQSNVQRIKNQFSDSKIFSAEALLHKPNVGVDPRLGMSSWLRDSGIHAVDMLNYVIGGRPTSIQSVSNGSLEKKENFSALICWGSNTHAIFSSNNTAGLRLERYVFHGYGTSAILDGSTLQIQHYQQKQSIYESIGGADGGIYEEHSAFLDALQEKSLKPVHSLENVASSLRLVELIEDGYCGEIDWSLFSTANNTLLNQNITIDNDQNVPVFKNPIVLILNPSIIAKHIHILRKNAQIRYFSDIESMSDEEKQRVIGMIVGGPGSDTPDESLFRQLPALKVLGVVGASVKRWGGDIAASRGVAVVNSADTLAEAVAEFVLMQAIIGLRQASVSHDVMKNGGWGFSASGKKTNLVYFAKKLLSIPQLYQVKIIILKFLPRNINRAVQKKYHSKTLYGRKVAFVGYGEITKKTIPLFQTFGCSIVVVSDYLNDVTAKELGVKCVSLEEALTADVVSLQRELTSRTAKSFDAKAINSLKPGSVLINSGRAGLVDNPALINRLKKGDVFACLDVFDTEPLEEKSEFRKLRNVFLSSHIAGSLNHIDGLGEASSLNIIQKVINCIQDKSGVSLENVE